MKTLVIAALIISICTACTKTDETERVLKNNGFTKIHLTGYQFFSCDGKDLFHTGFTAISPSGHPVKGVVCSGLLKGATIRFN